MGSLFAFIAFVSWGFGDFLIQKSARKFGNWISIFYISIVAAIGLLPFVYRDIPGLFKGGFSADLGILFLTPIVELATSLLFFESLRRGKIAVIEPIYAFEIPVTLALAWVLLGEKLSGLQIGLIALIVIGILLVSLESLGHLKKFRLEAGVILAVFATILTGGMDFLYGLSSRVTSPLMINWFSSVIVLVVTGAYLARSGGLKKLVPDLVSYPRTVIALAVVDNIAWIAYSVSMLYLPIAIATGISEAYIALAVLLGLVVNKEKLRPHQAVGLAVVLIGVTLLTLAAGLR